MLTLWAKKALLSALALLNTLSSPPPAATSYHVLEHIALAANSACSGTLYPDLCISTVSSFSDLKCKTLPNIITSTINHTLSEVQKTHSESKKYENKLVRNHQLLNIRDHRAIDDCVELLDQTASELKTSFSDVLNKKHVPDAQALLSAALTNQYTCLEGFESSKSQNIKNYFKQSLFNISRHVSNTLAMVSKIPGAENAPYAQRTKQRFPYWINSKDRRLLQSIGAGNGTTNFKYDVMVAKDGSGNFTTINEAVAIAPNSSATRFVIYIKAGAYFEYVEVVKKKMNIMFVGDGIGKTWIKGNRSVVDGWTTFRSSTLG